MGFDARGVHETKTVQNVREPHCPIWESPATDHSWAHGMWPAHDEMCCEIYSRFQIVKKQIIKYPTDNFILITCWSDTTWGTLGWIKYVQFNFSCLFLIIIMSILKIFKLHMCLAWHFCWMSLAQHQSRVPIMTLSHDKQLFSLLLLSLFYHVGPP